MTADDPHDDRPPPARPRVTVVIATRDRRENVLATLDRLRALPDAPAIVVVDNASSDGTPAAVRHRHPEVDVLEPGGNLGPAARTVGAAHADTPVVAFSDDDSWWAPGALDRAADLLAAHPRLGLVAGRILVEPGSRIDPLCAEMERSPLDPDPDTGYPQILGFVACGALVRRDAFLALGGFRPGFPIGGEESLLAIDLSAAGWTLVHVPEIVAHHQPATTGRSRRPDAERRNALWTAWLRRPLPRALRITAGVLASAGAHAPPTAAGALRGLPWIVRGRRVVPAAIESALLAIERTQA